MAAQTRARRWARSFCGPRCAQLRSSAPALAWLWAEAEGPEGMGVRANVHLARLHLRASAKLLTDC
jgi:hypothetical protein